MTVRYIMTVKKDQIYRAKARRGYRFVKVCKVRLADSHEPYVELIEVDEQGDKRTGKSWSQIPRSLKFNSQLICVDGKWIMPSYYSYFADAKASAKKGS